MVKEKNKKMPPKTLDQEVIDKNDGLVSMGVVKEAPEGNLPVLKENESVNDDPYSTLVYLCSIVEEKESYAPQVERMLDKVMQDNGFNKNEDNYDCNYYDRLRGKNVDYLFPTGYLEQGGTFGITVPFDEFGEFESLFFEPKKKDHNPALIGIVGVLVGVVGGLLVGSVVGGIGAAINEYTDLFGEYLRNRDIMRVSAASFMGIGVLILSPLGYYTEKHDRRESEKKYIEDMQKYKEKKEKYLSLGYFSNKQYDMGIIGKILKK